MMDLARQIDGIASIGRTSLARPQCTTSASRTAGRHDQWGQALPQPLPEWRPELCDDLPTEQRLEPGAVQPAIPGQGCSRRSRDRGDARRVDACDFGHLEEHLMPAQLLAPLPVEDASQCLPSPIAVQPQHGGQHTRDVGRPGGVAPLPSIDLEHAAREVRVKARHGGVRGAVARPVQQGHAQHRRPRAGDERELLAVQLVPAVLAERVRHGIDGVGRGSAVEDAVGADENQPHPAALARCRDRASGVHIQAPAPARLPAQHVGPPFACEVQHGVGLEVLDLPARLALFRQVEGHQLAARRGGTRRAQGATAVAEAADVPAVADQSLHDLPAQKP
mmetsp:Transcript_93441/g.302540  ORF Transcript_93441/g.302540 Transcript_93441/m.302540 type:complete len:335 (+) Transcript_93441:929-1933(+)